MNFDTTTIFVIKIKEFSLILSIPPYIYLNCEQNIFLSCSLVCDSVRWWFGMFTVEKFLCFKIETGGLIIGYLNCIAAVTLICIIVFNCKYQIEDSCKCNSIKDFLVGDDIVKLLLSLVGAVIYGVSSYFLINGIKSVI